MVRSLVAVSVLAVLVVTGFLFFVQGEPGEPSGVTITPSKARFVEGERITGEAMCEAHPPVVVKLIVDGVEMDCDSTPDPEEEHINTFKFASDGLVGRQVVLIATDMAGNFAQVIVQVDPRE